jgi:hypothetical protein
MDAEKALAHVGHNIEVATYGSPPVNVAVECIDCFEVIVDADVEPFRFPGYPDLALHQGATLVGGTVPAHVPGGYPRLSCCGGPIQLVPA